MKKTLITLFAIVCASALGAVVQAQGARQSEAEFQKLMPITGEVQQIKKELD